MVHVVSQPNHLARWRKQKVFPPKERESCSSSNCIAQSSCPNQFDLAFACRNPNQITFTTWDKKEICWLCYQQSHFCPHALIFLFPLTKILLYIPEFALKSSLYLSGANSIHGIKTSLSIGIASCPCPMIMRKLLGLYIWCVYWNLSRRWTQSYSSAHAQRRTANDSPPPAIFLSDESCLPVRKPWSQSNQGAADSEMVTSQQISFPLLRHIQSWVLFLFGMPSISSSPPWVLFWPQPDEQQNISRKSHKEAEAWKRKRAGTFTAHLDATEKMITMVAPLLQAKLSYLIAVNSTVELQSSDRYSKQIEEFFKYCKNIPMFAFQTKFRCIWSIWRPQLRLHALTNTKQVRTVIYRFGHGRI